MRLLSMSILLIVATSALAVTAEFEFNDNVSEQRYMDYISKIRCLLCQNESLGSSRADLAMDLRRQIYTMMNSGKSNAEISDYLVARYGDFILYQPPLKRSTLLLWLTPFILLPGLLLMIWRRIKIMQNAAPKPLNETESARAKKILTGNQDP